MLDEEKEVETEKEVEVTKEGQPELPIEEMAGVDLDVDLKTGEEKEEPPPEEKKEEKKEVKPPEPTVKEKELAERLERLESDKRDLKKALHEARQEKKKSKEPEVTLSDAELMKIVEEHKDDPKVMFNAVAYKVQQMMKTGKTEAVNEVEIKNKQQQLNAILKERVKDFDDEGSESREIINRTKTNFNLEDHPLGDFLAAAAAVYADLPNVAKGWFEAGKKEGLNGKAEEIRKDGIKKTQLTPGGSKLSGGKVKDESLTPSQMETAKRLGFTTPEKLKLYKSQILKGANA